ncbi:hypothetical protein LCGC14_2624340, partial [marine sediment metagenome]
VLGLSVVLFSGLAADAGVTKETRKIIISETDAKKLPAYTSKDAVYNKGKSELSFTVETASGKAYRLVHNGQKVMALIEGTDITFTTSIYTIEEFVTKQQALDRINSLGLEYDPVIIED